MNLRLVDDVRTAKIADHSCVGWGYTYFVRRGDLIKIGHSAVPKDRMTALQCNFPEPLEVLAIVSNTFIDEPTAHKKFDHLRVRGEWFRAAPDLLEFITQVKAEADRAPTRPYPTMKATELTGEIERCCRHLKRLRAKRPLGKRSLVTDLIAQLEKLPRNPDVMRPTIRQTIRLIEAEQAGL